MKTVENSFKIAFPSRSCNEAFARMAISAFITYLDPTLDELADIRTSVSEAVTNCIVHAYAQGIGVITMKADIGDDRTVEIWIKDKGCGIEDIHRAMQPSYTGSEGGERAGLGFSVMAAFMDEVRVRSRPGRGTTVCLTKKLRERPKE